MEHFYSPAPGYNWDRNEDGSLLLEQPAYEETFNALRNDIENYEGPEYGECPAWDSLVNAMDHIKTVAQLVDVARLMRAHGPTCNNHILQASPAAQCAACMCDRKDVVSDRTLLRRPDAVCCGEAA